MDIFADSLLCSKSIRTPAILHGIKYESVAVQEFERMYDFKTYECGLFVCPDYPFLAASPDRVIDNKTIIEVKCPFSSKDKPVTAVTVPYLVDNGGGDFELNEHHDYYYQMQGQLLCSNRQCCYFIVYTNKSLVAVRIMRNETFIKKMITSLETFYQNHFKRAILNKCMYKNYNNFN